MKRRALITGLSGFAGWHLADQLLAEGWEIAGTSWSRRADMPGVAEHRIEACDRAGLRGLIGSFGPHVIFHLAAIVDTVKTPDITRLHTTNIMGTVAVVEAMRESGSDARLVYASSAFVYGAPARNAQPISETQALVPLTPYGASKVAGEAIVQQFARETGAATMIARAFQHTGPRHVGAYALADWAEQLALLARADREGTLICGSLDVERDYLDVRDVASAYRAIATHGARDEIYNVCSGQPRSMRSLLEGLIAAAGVRPEIQVDAGRARRIDQPVFYGDSGKLRSHTGWQPTFTIEQTLADLLTFWRARIDASKASTASEADDGPTSASEEMRSQS